MEEFRTHLSEKDFGSLNMHHRTFMMTLLFLPEIWNRIREDALLDVKYWEVYVVLYEPGADEREPSTQELEILDTWQKHRFRLNLDVEDWFIHSHILMDKFARFVKRLLQLISRTPQELELVKRIPHRSFAKHRKFFLKRKNRTLEADPEYAEIIRKNTSWYVKDLKNIRDDLIQHEAVPRFWSYDVSRNRVRLSRFRPNPKLLKVLYGLRDKYASTYPELEGEGNFFKLFSIFEEYSDGLDEDDVTKVERVRKSYGARFPDMPELFKKMSDFFSCVNDHFVLEVLKPF